MKRTIPHYVIIILIGIIFLQRECHRCPEVQTITTTDTIPGDSVPYAVEVPKPIPYWIDTGSWHYQTQQIDTMAILRDYFARVYYLDTIMDDSSAFIAILDTITQNRIHGRKLYFANRKPTSIINTTTVLPTNEKSKLYVGGMVAMNPGDKFDIGPSMMLITPRGGYSYAYGVNENSHTFTVVWKIKLQRKRPP